MTTADTNMRTTPVSSSWNWVQPGPTYAPPTGYEPGPSPSGAPSSNWTASAQADQTTSEQLKSANRSRAKSEIVGGLIMIVLGITITVGTIMMRLPIFIVSWGPVVFGTVRMVKGFKLLATG
jgi:hypothetical protein